MGAPRARPAEAKLEVWQATASGKYEQVAEAVGDDLYEAVAPYPVAVRPADLVRQR